MIQTTEISHIEIAKIKNETIPPSFIFRFKGGNDLTMWKPWIKIVSILFSHYLKVEVNKVKQILNIKFINEVNKYQLECALEDSCILMQGCSKDDLKELYHVLIIPLLHEADSIVHRTGNDRVVVKDLSNLLKKIKEAKELFHNPAKAISSILSKLMVPIIDGDTMIDFNIAY